MKECNLNCVLGLFMAILVANCVLMGLVLFEIQGLRADLVAMEPIEIEILEASEETLDEADKHIEEIPEKPVEGVKTAITEVIEEEIEPVAEAADPETIYFDIPLSEDLQIFLFEVCEEYGVPPELVVAMIDQESEFDPGAENAGAQGLMQVMPKWHKDRMARLGCTDLYDPYQNINVGVDYMAELIGQGKGYAWALMAYNGGPAYANKKVASGEVSTYASTILDLAENYRR